MFASQVSQKLVKIGTIDAIFLRLLCRERRPKVRAHAHAHAHTVSRVKFTNFPISAFGFALIKYFSKCTVYKKQTRLLLLV